MNGVILWIPPIQQALDCAASFEEKAKALAEMTGRLARKSEPPAKTKPFRWTELMRREASTKTMDAWA